MKVIDLTHDINSEMMTYPGDPPVILEEALTHEADYCHVDRLICSSHTGTHIDAPYHFLEDGKRITDYPASKFVGEGVVCDLHAKKAGEAITAEDISETLSGSHSGSISGAQPGDYLLLQTGWDQYWGKDEYLDHPYISREAAQLIVDSGISIVAVDFLNVDPTLYDQWEAHPLLLSNDVLIVENIANSLALSPGRRYCFSFAPMKLQNSDGAPIRALAWEINDGIT